MKREIQKRKKGFWALCLAILLTWMQLAPQVVYAATEYEISGEHCDTITPNTDMFLPGDVLQYRSSTYNVSATTVSYIDYNDNVLFTDTISHSSTEEVTKSIIVASYDTFSGTAMENEQFKGWKKDYTYGSGYCLAEIKLKAVGYTKSTISYELGADVTNPTSNPTYYYEGKEEIALSSAQKDGAVFAGWYSDSGFTTRIESITTESTGNITLYPKFHAIHSISYEFNGGTYEGELPSEYIEEVGLQSGLSLPDLEKPGYNFVGWFSDSSFTQAVDATFSGLTGDITLYAKFTGNTYDITYVLGEDVTVAGTNPTTYTCGDGVTSFYDAVKMGHTFLGWYETSGDAEVKVEKIPDSRFGHITLKPKFTPATYDINYVLDDGTNGAGNLGEYTYGTGVPNLADASKSGYTFVGWYSENTFTNKVSSIAANDTGDKTLWARFLQNYTITYELNGGTVTTGANPDHYVAGEVVTSFADAAKTGYTFGGWYSDAACTAGNEVTEISATQTGDITLYAKFIVNDYQITYVLDGGTNGEGNPTGYVQGLGVASFADATKTGYTFGGWYSDASFTTAVTSISATQTGNLTLYAKFTVNESRVELQEGVGAIKVNDSYYGESVKPVLASITNGTDHVVITYKKKGADDATYTAEVPVKPGDYTVRAVFAETDVYKEVTVTADFSIIYLEAPKEPCKISGTKGKNSYYTTNVTITPVAGYLIADALDGTYQEKLEFSKTTDAFSVYLKKADTGAKTAGIKMSEIRIDKNAPVISGAKNGETIYGETVKIVVKDANLSRVTVNGKKVAVADEKLVMSLSSDRGEEKYVIIGEDLAGNKKKKTITIAAEWTKKKKIPSGEKVKLYKNRSYSFGTKSFKVSNDDTTYAGNTTFYVGSDGDYIFSETN